jgi:hypothetical protein
VQLVYFDHSACSFRGTLRLRVPTTKLKCKQISCRYFEVAQYKERVFVHYLVFSSLEVSTCGIFYLDALDQILGDIVFPPSEVVTQWIIDIDLKIKYKFFPSVFPSVLIHMRI